MNKYKVNLSKKGNQINSVDDWYNYAPPMKKDIHWKDGKSAKELAKYIIEPNKYLPQELEVLLIKIGCRPSGEFQGEPEAITGLKSRGQGRTHDLLLVKENEVVVGIEAKVEEPLDEPVYKIVEKLIMKNPEDAKGKYERLKYLYKCIYDSEIDNTYLQYQLLTATVGTLLEAEKAGAKKAVLAVITFISSLGYMSNSMKKNKDDLNYFISTISKYKKSDGFYRLPGFEDIEFYVEDLYI